MFTWPHHAKLKTDLHKALHLLIQVLLLLTSNMINEEVGAVLSVPLSNMVALWIWNQSKAP